MDNALRWAGNAVALLSSLPLQEMNPSRFHATSGASGEVYTLFKPGEVYLIYHDRAAGPLTLDLSAASAADVFDVRWFDPRLGGVLQVGDVARIQGGSNATDLGSAPHTPDDDWVCLVLAQSSLLFADGFESGTTSAWDSSQP